MKKRIRFLPLLLCILVLVLVSCNSGEMKDDANKGAASANALALIADGQANCCIVRPKGISKTQMSLCADLVSLILQKTGVEVELVADSSEIKNNQIEILIGDTNRLESSQAKEKLGDFEYSISIINEKVVLAASDSAMLESVLREFISLINDDSQQIDNGSWEMPIDYNETFDGSDYGYNAYVGIGYELTTEYTEIGGMAVAQNGPASNGRFFKDAQGGCTDGTYYYVFMCTGADVQPEKCRIIKFDLATQTRVMISEELSLGHASDATYNPSTHTIYVTLGGGEKEICEIDPDTLTVKGRVELPYWAGGISYNHSRKMYVMHAMFTYETHKVHYLYYYNENFEYMYQHTIEGMLAEFDPDLHMSPQGIASDDEFIYILEYCQSSEGILNNIVVYDFLTGEFVDRIPLHMGRETENLGIWNNSFYIFCNNSKWTGFESYQVKIVPDLKK